MRRYRCRWQIVFPGKVEGFIIGALREAIEVRSILPSIPKAAFIFLASAQREIPRKRRIERKPGSTQGYGVQDWLEVMAFPLFGA